MTSAEQMKSIEDLRGAALREKFHEVVGIETRSKDRPYLIKKIVQTLQARVAAGPEPTTAARATKAPAQPHEQRERDPRLPAPGTVLEREYEGKTVRVKVLEDGFEFRGKPYRSLSAIAREVTSTSWNGWLFFKIIPYAKRAKAA